MKIMKLKYILPAAVLCAAVFSVHAHAADVKVFVDDEQIVFSDVQASIIDSRTYVPLRGVFEKLGYTVEWDGATKTATLKNGNTAVIAKTDDLRIEKDDSRRAVGGSAYPIIIEGRMMLPVRAISEASGCAVTWDAETHAVGIYSQDTMPSDYKNPQGKGTKGEEDYISEAYRLCNEVKNIASDSKNEGLLRFLGRGYENVKTINITTSGNDRLKETADAIYALEPSGNAGTLQPFFKTYADTLCKYISITAAYSSEEISLEEAIAQIDSLKEEKDELAITFSVALNDYFKQKNVFYEGVYDEYVLDMLK